MTVTLKRVKTHLKWDRITHQRILIIYQRNYLFKKLEVIILIITINLRIIIIIIKQTTITQGKEPSPIIYKFHLHLMKILSVKIQVNKLSNKILLESI